MPNCLLGVRVWVPLVPVFRLWTGIPSERRFAILFPQDQRVSQKIWCKQQVWPIEIFQKENDQPEVIYAIFHLNCRVFYPNFLWIREGIFEPLRNVIAERAHFQNKSENCTVSTFEMTKARTLQKPSL